MAASVCRCVCVAVWVCHCVCVAVCVCVFAAIYHSGLAGIKKHTIRAEENTLYVSAVGWKLFCLFLMMWDQLRHIAGFGSHSVS